MSHLPQKNFVEPTNDLPHIEILTRSLKKQRAHLKVSSFEEGILEEH